MVAIYASFDDSQNHREQHDRLYKLLYEVLQRYYGYPMDKIQLCKTEDGKPYCKDSSLQFSLCHTDGLSLVAISDFPCGIDAEKSDRVVSDRVAGRFLKREAATVLDWTRYESIGKLIGCGIPYDPSLMQSYHTRVYNQIEGYTVCCASFREDFPQDIIIL